MIYHVFPVGKMKTEKLLTSANLLSSWGVANRYHFFIYKIYSCWTRTLYLTMTLCLPSFVNLMLIKLCWSKNYGRQWQVCKKFSIFPFQMQLLWLDKFNYSAITNHCYSQHLYFPYNLYWMGRKKKQVETIVNVTNKGQQQLMLDAIQVLTLR